MTKKRNWLQIGVILVAVGLLISNIFLIAQNVQLRSTLKVANILSIEEGYKFRTIPVTSLNGEKDELDLADGKLRTLILYFRTSCEYCKQQYPYWKELSAKIDPSNWRVILVTRESELEDIGAHLKENDMETIKAVSVLPKDAQAARMAYTPTTVVVAKNGEVTKVWTGLWKSNEIANVYKTFE